MDKGEALLKGGLVPDRTAVQFHLQVQDLLAKPQMTMWVWPWGEVTVAIGDGR